MYRPFTRERGNAWSRIADSLNSNGNPEFYVNQSSVRERFNLILTRYKTKIFAEVRATGIEVKEQTSTENLLEELDEKIKEAEAEFEAKTLEQSQKAEKEKVAIEDVRKKALETLAETKKRKQQEGQEVKRTKKSRTTGNETLAYLREKATKDHEVRMLQMKTQNEETRAQRLLLEQYHRHQQQQQQTQQQMLLLLQNQQQAMMALFEKLSKKGE